MDLKQIIAAASRMFPSADLQNAVQKAEQAISGTADTLEGVQSTARRLGIDPNIANSLYARYGKTMQAKALCGLLGTTPEALRSDANKDPWRRAERLPGPAEGESGRFHQIPPAEIAGWNKNTKGARTHGRS